ncbi:MAG TPA: queuosine precursor transporter [Thermodesulfobacteriota bacterium]|nr:queuosine precursor transporter [Thermodesulfobacteriota bacterium]
MPRHQWLPAITAVFVTSLVISNIIAVKVIAIGPFYLPAGVLIFPVSYIFGDILTEVYGYARARRVIWIGFACNLLAVLVIWASMELPAAPFWKLGGFDGDTSQQAYKALFAYTPRILAASFLAYLAGEFLNSFVLAKMKIATEGRHLWLRTIGSTAVGQLADSGVFIFLAFSGMIPFQALAGMWINQWWIKSAYEAVATPFTYLAVNRLKGAEKEDHYDRETDFNPLRWKE